MNEIPSRVMAELEAAEIAPGRPLVVVDADEVLVHFAEDFRLYCERAGYTFNLTEYNLSTALRDPDGWPVPRERIDQLIGGFIDAETRAQSAIDGAAAALRRLAEAAQILVLTNAPYRVRAQRIENLRAHGMDYPVVMNEGGKGRALAWLRDRASAPVAFVDDSPVQLGSAAKHAPEIARLHLRAPTIIQRIVDASEHATDHPEDWLACEAAIWSRIG